MQVGQLQTTLTEFERRGATLWAVSADPLEEAQRLGKKLALTFPIGADPELTLIRQFGVEMEGREIAIPSMFVLERSTGRIVWRYLGETMFDRPKLQPVLQAIEQAGGTPSTASTTPAPAPTSP